MSTPKIYDHQTLDLVFTITDQDGVIVDLSLVSSHNIDIRNKNGDYITVAGILPGGGADGVLSHELSPSQLSVKGIWEAQALIVDGAKEYPANIISFRVLPRLKPVT